MVITTSEGLVAYTSEVLPALGVTGVVVTTFAKWSASTRRTHFPWLAQVEVHDGTPPYVSRLKKHPAVVKLLEERCMATRDVAKLRSDPRTPLDVWAEVLTDLDALRKAIGESDMPMPEAEIRSAHRWCADRCPAIADVGLDEDAPRPDPEARPSDDDEVRGNVGIDGQPTQEEFAQLDPEDEALLLRAYQVARGPLRKGKEALQFEHVFVDEAQDFSVAELGVLVEITTPRRSITLAGDTSQRLVLDNSFRGWKQLLTDLGIQGVEVEPLRIAYRSTREVLEVARAVLGPLAEALPSQAPRTGAPVEMFIVPNAGVAVAHLGEALRILAAHEPRATVAVLARYSDQADLYYDGLKRSEVPNLRRVRSHDFAFRPGVEVTQIRDVKGLEYDYVIIIEANSSTFPEDDESRHLLHVAATRAAHQLWLVATETPCRILPSWLIDSAL